MNVYEMFIEMSKRFKNVRCIERETGTIYKKLEDIPVKLAEKPEYYVMFKPEVKYVDFMKEVPSVK